ncbi:MAG: SAM-dependent methyltransferase [Firmicutes bacterium]|nr:SAM-dependent methyltransferase [Bacillota bacterium]
MSWVTKKINISNRLKTIGDFVIDNSKVVDVGCDHALLSIYLYQNRNNINVISTDINNGPLNEAKNNIKNYKLENKIETRLSDGLKNIEKNEFDTIIIAGMGGNTIVDILGFDIDKTISANRIIIQANNNVDKVRKFLVNNNFKITDEKLVKENNIISIVILFTKNTKNIKYSRDEILFGPILLKENNILFKELLSNTLKKYSIILNKIPRKYIIKRYKMNKYISKIKSYIS